MGFHPHGLGRPERIVILVGIVASVLLTFILSVSQSPNSSVGLVQAQAQPTSQSANPPKPKDSLQVSPHYVGPPQYMRHRGSEKFHTPVLLDLNSVDSLTLLKVPGIGPAFAHRILGLRQRLGGYYTILQLQEVYGVDQDKFAEIRPWFAIKTPPKTFPLEHLRPDSIPRHLYMSYAQLKALKKYLRREGVVRSWEALMGLGVFTQEDSVRLSPYYPEVSNKQNKQ